MPRLFFVALFLLLIGCSAQQSSMPVQAGQTPTVAPPLLISPTATVTPVLSTALSPTPSLACDWQHAPCQALLRAWLQRPIASSGSDCIDLSYLFGTTQGGQRVPHHGVEFPNPAGTPVLAAAAGQVVVAGNDHKMAYGPGKDLYGNLVVLEHHFPQVEQPVYT
ncbi:MAG: peptidoglycan DD-metalloendopeptidase family protein, partial [Anaerolineae bacterium]